jgi:2Fe-2S ferredoxin
MITVRFVDAAGVETRVPLRTGQSLMRAALSADVQGIAADCGGSLTCATCHVRVRAPHAALLPAREPDEDAMLEFTAVPRSPDSRLSCQIVLTDALDGMTVDLPATQY